MSDFFEKTDEHCIDELAFRRWLVREIEEQRTTVSEAMKSYNFHPKNGFDLIRSWRQKYGTEMVLALTEMTLEEKKLVPNSSTACAALRGV